MILFEPYDLHTTFKSAGLNRSLQVQSCKMSISFRLSLHFETKKYLWLFCDVCLFWRFKRSSIFHIHKWNIHCSIV